MMNVHAREGGAGGGAEVSDLADGSKEYSVGSS